MIKRVLFTAGFMMLGLVQVASADYSATLTFQQPVGPFLATDTIPVWVTLTLDPSSDPIITDTFGNANLPLDQVIADLFQPVSPDLNLTPGGDTLTSNTNELLYCTGTFFQGCSGGTPDLGPYDWNWNSGANSFFVLTGLDLEPGTSTNFLIATLTPVGGSAPGGTYTLPGVALFIQVYDQNAQDTYNAPLHIADITLGSTYNNGAPFTATVTPEPGFYAMLGLALSGLLVFARRRLSLRGQAN